MEPYDVVQINNKKSIYHAQFGLIKAVNKNGTYMVTVTWGDTLCFDDSELLKMVEFKGYVEAEALAEEVRKRNADSKTDNSIRDQSSRCRRSLE